MDDVESEAVLPLRAVVPNTAAPSWKVTVPVAVPVGEPTCAVKMTAWPTVGGFSEEATAVEVPALTPVPDRGTVVPVGEVLSITLRVALPGPTTLGAKDTSTWQEFPFWRVALVQRSDWRKKSASPET